MALRIFRIVTAILLVTLLLVNIFVQNWEIKGVSLLILVVWLLILVLQVYYVSRVSRKITPPKVYGKCIG